jgi:glycosyltransferase involved in cell wall biosynthesis
MKVLHIINSLHTGGAEKLLADSLPIYKEYGVEIDLLLLNSDDTPFLQSLKSKFIGRIFYTHVNSYYSPVQLWQIRKYLKSDYDIIHCHLFPVLYWTVLAKLLANNQKKMIFTEHNTENRRLNNLAFLQVDKFIYRYYDKVTAITPQVKQVLIDKLHLPNQKVEVIYNGIDVEKFATAMSYQKSMFFDDTDTIIIQVSRFQKQKDQQTVIYALSDLPENYKLLLVGDGELKNDCQALVNELNLQQRVKFLGVRMDVPALLKMADIIVQSSHWEGFGLAAVEGMAAGRPLVASNVAGLRDIVKDYGLLFEKGNATELASKILQLQDKNFYDDIAKKCAQRASDFHILKMVEKTISLYKELLE